MPSVANVFQAVLRSLLSSPVSTEKMEQVEREETAVQLWDEIIGKMKYMQDVVHRFRGGHIENQDQEMREIVHKQNID